MKDFKQHLNFLTMRQITIEQDGAAPETLEVREAEAPKMYRLKKDSVRNKKGTVFQFRPDSGNGAYFSVSPNFEMYQPGEMFNEDWFEELKDGEPVSKKAVTKVLNTITERVGELSKCSGTYAEAVSDVLYIIQLYRKEALGEG